MMIFRLSQKLAKKIKAGGMGEVPVGENPFIDWSAHLFIVARTQYVLLTNTRSLYSVVMYGRGVADTNDLIQRALESMRELMAADGLLFVYKDFIVPASGTVFFGKALDRRVTGSMNDLVRMAEVWLSETDLSPHDVSFKLNDTPMTLLAQGPAETHGIPRKVFQAVSIERRERG